MYQTQLSFHVTAISVIKGVFARVSDQWGWIQRTICAHHSDVNKPDWCDAIPPTVSPSVPPTLSPTNFPVCTDDEMTVDVDLITDAYPYETTWTITDSDSNVVAIQSYDASNERYKHRFCLSPNTCHKFQILDTYGDGLFFPGGYNLTVDGEVQEPSVSDGYYSFAKFGECSTCAGISVWVDIFTDQYPGETSWVITNLSDEVVESGGGYSSPFR